MWPCLSKAVLLSTLQVLLVSSRNTPDEWTIPGGGLDPGEQPSETAVREAMEEVFEYRSSKAYVLQ